MIAKLPRWVWAGAAVLALCAGMINVIAILGFVHKGITHVTGNCSLLSVEILNGDWKSLKETFCVIASFFLGSVLAGIIIRDAHLRMGRRYGVALAVECVLLLVSTYGFIRGASYGEFFASMAAGLQNAMASTYSEAIVRTTHLTGILTDLGSLVGHALRRIKIDLKRIRLLSTIFISFLVGGLLGAITYRSLGALAMSVPAVIIGASAVFYEFFRRTISKNKFAPLSRLAEPISVEAVSEPSNSR